MHLVEEEKKVGKKKELPKNGSVDREEGGLEIKRKNETMSGEDK